MPSKQPRGTRSVSELPAKAQLATLERSLFVAHGHRLSRHPDVVGLGIGYRERNGRIDTDREPCLVVSVRRKQSTKGAKRIPLWFSCKDPEYGRIAARSDVVGRGVVKLQSNIVSSPSLAAGSKAGSVLGVARLGKTRFMITAGHVLAKRKHKAKITWSKGKLRGGGLCHRALVFQSAFRSAEKGPGVLDLGLVRAAELGPLGKWQMFPSGNSILPWESVARHPDIEICGRSGVRAARLARLVLTGHEDLLIAGRPYFRCILYEFKGSATKPGDSGAAVITKGGALAGIHLGIWRDKQTGARYSLCQSAGDVAQAAGRLFGPQLEIYTRQ